MFFNANPAVLSPEPPSRSNIQNVEGMQFKGPQAGNKKILLSQSQNFVFIFCTKL